MAQPINVDSKYVERLILNLGKIGEHSGTGIWWTGYSPEWMSAVDQFASWCHQNGLTVHRDAVGNMWGRRAITGAIKPHELDSQVDGYGITMREAMVSVGLNLHSLGTARRSDIDTFIELHIKQGPVLEATNLGVGIVTANNYGRRLNTLKGLTPYEYIRKCRTNHTERFNLNPIHQMTGLNISLYPTTMELKS